MNGTVTDYKRAFETGLVKHGFTFQVDADDMYSISQVDKPDRKVIAKLICSKPIIEKIHGRINNTKIQAIGYFLFDLSPGAIKPDLYSFAFFNANDNKIEFVIIPTDELKNRLRQRKRITENNQRTEMKFWLLPDNLLFEITNFGAEGEWWFVDGRMAKGTNWDYTEFLITDN